MVNLFKHDPPSQYGSIALSCCLRLRKWRLTVSINVILNGSHIESHRAPVCELHRVFYVVEIKTAVCWFCRIHPNRQLVCKAGKVRRYCSSAYILASVKFLQRKGWIVTQTSITSQKNSIVVLKKT